MKRAQYILALQIPHITVHEFISWVPPRLKARSVGLRTVKWPIPRPRHRDRGPETAAPKPRPWHRDPETPIPRPRYWDPDTETPRPERISLDRDRDRDSIRNVRERRENARRNETDSFIQLMSFTRNSYEKGCQDFTQDGKILLLRCQMGFA